MSDMRHMEKLGDVAASDVRVLMKKEATYRGSWKVAGGRSAWFMFRRNMDRLLNMMAKPKDDFQFSLLDLDDVIEQSYDKDKDGVGDCTVAACVMKYLRDSFVSEDIFAQIELAPSGADGTVLACLRDLRRYGLLVEAEMVARGEVKPELAGEALVLGTLSEMQSDSLDKIMSLSQSIYEMLPLIPDVDDVNMLRLKNDAVELAELLGVAETATPKTPDDAQDIWTRLADHWKVSREAAKTRAVKVLFGPVSSRSDKKPATPEDGGHHASLAPWILSEMPSAQRLRKFYQDYAMHVKKLEPHLTEAEIFDLNMVATDGTVSTDVRALASSIMGCYVRICENSYVLRIDQAPEGWRAAWPTLRHEYNEKEKRDLPHWQQVMLVWLESQTKWVLGDRFQSWKA